MLSVTSKHLPIQAMPLPDAAVGRKVAGAAAVTSAVTPLPSSANASAVGNAGDTNPVASAAMTSHIKLTADDLSALQSIDTTGNAAQSPARQARAAIAADPQLGDMPFGKVVSQLARGLVPSVPDSGNTNSPGNSDGSSATDSTSAGTSSGDVAVTDNTATQDTASTSTSSGSADGTTAAGNTDVSATSDTPSGTNTSDASTSVNPSQDASILPAITPTISEPDPVSSLMPTA